MNKRGFTLVELMIVVCIIGMLGAVAIPSMRNARIQAQAMAIANDMRVFGQAFSQHSIDYKGYYPFSIAGNLPDAVAQYLKTPDDFPKGPACGGSYRYYPAGMWVAEAGNNPHAISIQGVSPQNRAQLAAIDKLLDDGVQGWSGMVWWGPGWLHYFIER